MSGTSMDGIDAALVRISGRLDHPRVRLLAFATTPYPDWVRKQLLAVAGGESTTAEEISQLDSMLGAAFGEAAIRVCRRGDVSPQRLSVIGSHGQTIFHYGGPRHVMTREFEREFKKLMPMLRAMEAKFKRESPGEPAYAVSVRLESFPKLKEALLKGTSGSDLWSVARPTTLQIGEPALIAERTGVPVVADFRAADMAAGGQGAPLVPMVDYLLLRHQKQGTVALNIGGIANVTVIPANASPEQVFGFDTGPGNMLIDALVRRFTRDRKAYDAGGRLAARGRIIEPILTQALNFPFFHREPPKSFGREQFGNWFVEHYFVKRKRCRFYDLLRTATELTIVTIAEALERFVLTRARVDRLVVSGGGAHNRLLLAGLQASFPRLSIELSDQYGLPVDAKEAIAFALLADRTMHALPGNLPSVTGARRAVVLGKLVRP
jgi:anhydro-N-acetylmuramic acid kinase